MDGVNLSRRQGVADNPMKNFASNFVITSVKVLAGHLWHSSTMTCPTASLITGHLVFKVWTSPTDIIFPGLSFPPPRIPTSLQGIPKNRSMAVIHWFKSSRVWTMIRVGCFCRAMMARAIMVLPLPVGAERVPWV